MLRQVAPFMSYGDFTGHAPLSACAFWPVQPTSTPHLVAAPGLPPVLVVSTTNDPATPTRRVLIWPNSLAERYLRSRARSTPSYSRGNSCVGYAANYLLDLTLPPPGALLMCRVSETDV